MQNKIRPIAIHLPQFHPFAENDEWWGKGFTEWTNVTKAKPLFKGHYQPHLPADLGFYDLRLEEARLAQIALAKQYGIYGFCYYHYWFNGKRLMHEPLDRMLANKKEDFPFMLCWANENWTRRWDGAENEILIEQIYSEDDDLDHIQFLCEHFFKDPRYIRINGKPFFSIYRPNLLPNLEETISIWRKAAHDLGIGEIYIGLVNTFGAKYDLIALKADISIEFAPHFKPPENRYYEGGTKIIERFNKNRNYWTDRINLKLLSYINYGIANRFKLPKNKVFDNNVFYDYQELVEREVKRELPKNTFPSIFPMWDNSARKNQHAFVAVNSTPQIYEKWLKSIFVRFKPLSSEENFVFITAWNEWAEGNHLEPCRKWGIQYLEATKRAIDVVNI